MRITDLRARTCSIPIEAPTRHSYASPSFYSRTILELTTDETDAGRPIVGLGETYGTVSPSAFEPLRPLLIGADPFDLQRLLIQIRQRGYISRQSMLAAPVEFCCLDIQGKAYGRPVSDLLGGRVRDAVDTAAYVFYRYPMRPPASPRSPPRRTSSLMPVSSSNGTASGRSS